jgi:hypothetical protein
MKQRPKSIVRLSRKILRTHAEPRLMRRSEQVFVAMRQLETVDDLVAFAAEMPDVNGGEQINAADQQLTLDAIDVLRDRLYGLMKYLLTIERAAERGNSDNPPEIIVDRPASRREQ